MHKPNVPLRPIISTVNSVPYNLASWLARHLSVYIGKISNSHVKNSVDFTERISNVNLVGKKMISYDVRPTTLTRVPIDLTFNLLTRFFRENRDFNLPFGNIVFFKLLRLAISQNSFTFNGSFYKQIFGLGMGNPLSRFK